jgi:hypothetical protein
MPAHAHDSCWLVHQKHAGHMIGLGVHLCMSYRYVELLLTLTL